jgi:hypothetical protein
MINEEILLNLHPEDKAFRCGRGSLADGRHRRRVLAWRQPGALKLRQHRTRNALNDLVDLILFQMYRSGCSRICRLGLHGERLQAKCKSESRYGTPTPHAGVHSRSYDLENESWQHAREEAASLVTRVGTSCIPLGSHFHFADQLALTTAGGCHVPLPGGRMEGVPVLGQRGA